MRSLLRLAFTGLFIGLSSSSPLAAPTQNPTRTILEPRAGTATAPCGRVSEAYFSGSRGAPNPTIPAQLAYECIKSVPINTTAAKALLKSIRPYLGWQSNIDVLKNPPEEYTQKAFPAHDIFARLNTLNEDLDSGKYTREHDFGWDLYTTLQKAHDGHLGYVPDSVGSIFSWGRRVPLVSVSEDGVKLPAVFAYEDILGLKFKNISYTPSAIVKIDNQDVVKFLEDFSHYGSLQDRDGLWNNLFYELAQVSLGGNGGSTGLFTGGTRARWVYPGATTTLTFANGTSRTIDNYARVLINFKDINTGEDLARKWFSSGVNDQKFQEKRGGNTYVSANPHIAEEATPASAAPSAPPGYPSAVVPGPNNIINGYYLSGAEYNKTAVLSIPNYVGDGTYELSFQAATKQFLSKAVSDGKEKLIIDLSANGGGTILQGYDTFKQLFPSLEPYGANRFRAEEPAINILGQQFSAYSSQFPRSLDANNTNKVIQGSPFDYHMDVDVNGNNFNSWKHKFGPVTWRGTKYTNTMRWNLSDVLIPWNSGGLWVSGYGEAANASKTQPFKAENIVILGDGYCASTCTIFAELMRRIAGVKTISLGGRPTRNPTQPVGGTRGVNNYQWSYIQELAQIAIENAPADQKGSVRSALRDYLSNIPFQRFAVPASVNVRDGLRKNDDSGTPLQFYNDVAECRLYYTPEMTVDVTAIWKAAAEAQWGENGKCVKAGYSVPGKREERTTKLQIREADLQVGRAHVERLEQAFSLETDPKWQAEGFMQP